MELHTNHQVMFGKRKNHPSSARWVKEWVPQDLACTGGKCLVLKWVREDVLQALKEQAEGQGGREPEPEPTTEILFLCSYEGCGKTFIDAGALRKHSHIHGERQYACHYEGCGKKFLDSSKLKRHFLIHTGQRDFICPHEGCGKAFSLDFNLRAHMRTHTQENYHLCPYEGCGKRFAHDYKLQAHIKANHEKNIVKHTPSTEKQQSTYRSPASINGSGSSNRPYVCPYEGCGKDYIHEYKLNLHLRKEHSNPYFVESDKHASTAMFGVGLNAPDQNTFLRKVAINEPYKSSKHNPISRTPLAITRKEIAVPNLNVGRQWPARDEADSEETEEEGCDKTDDGWVYQETNEYNEETEDEEQVINGG